MKKVLIIEDEDSLRNNISEMLEHFSYEVKAASDGISGLSLAQEFQPDIIICDIMMPGIDGHEVLSKIRENQDLYKTAFIFLTAKAGRNDLRLGMDMGADDYITKPFSKEELLNAVNSRMNRILKLTASNAGEEQSDIPEEFRQCIALLPELSRTETKVLGFVSEGLTTRQIAEKMFVSYKTVENHRANISAKLKLKGPNSLINFVFFLRGKKLI